MKNPFDMTVSQCADAAGRYTQLAEDLARVAGHMGLPPETPPFVVLFCLTDVVFLLQATQPGSLADYVGRAKTLSEMLEKNK